MSKPYISIVVATRNDDHGGGMNRRFQEFMNHLAGQCAAHCLNAELVVVEWNPPEDRPSLTDALIWPAEPYLDIRVITVPAVMHRTFYNADKLPFFQMIAKNVGIRRSRGDWVLATCADVLFNDELCTRMKERLDSDAFYRVNRTDISARVLPADLSCKERLAFCQNHVIRVHYQMDMRLHFNACGDFTLMHRDAWNRLRGYPEFKLHSMHIDSWTLGAADALGLRQVVFADPARMYHIEHGQGAASDPKWVLQQPNLDYILEVMMLDCLMQKNHRPLLVNSPNWGLADKDLLEKRPSSV